MTYASVAVLQDVARGHQLREREDAEEGPRRCRLKDLGWVALLGLAAAGDEFEVFVIETRARVARVVADRSQRRPPRNGGARDGGGARRRRVERGREVQRREQRECAGRPHPASGSAKIVRSTPKRRDVESVAFRNAVGAARA
eukprot:CAMPEP_0184101618 /NCGR_PEP_ID=MMETSP0974-20121125/12925_1 /TAXON_ID=483370 /ORGANISM="non described non described, Strain CCMP2097" /LENGTH=142 /DNA_ID=CAMNT_0026404551 /DNA_START=178 /DNA_END=602 /DNA_ORIENTATION=+